MSGPPAAAATAPETATAMHQPPRQRSATAAAEVGAALSGWREWLLFVCMDLLHLVQKSIEFDSIFHFVHIFI
ncbi:MAG: hypothetical protein RMJ88_13155 [Thermogemmata sp.]|nr:hypothetical protein [Thermogemmata sp.]